MPLLAYVLFLQKDRDEWTSVWMNDWIDEWMKEWMHHQINTLKYIASSQGSHSPGALRGLSTKGGTGGLDLLEIKICFAQSLRVFNFYWRSQGALHLEKMHPSAAPVSGEEHQAPAACRGCPCSGRDPGVPRATTGWHSSTVPVGGHLCCNNQPFSPSLQGSRPSPPCWPEAQPTFHGIV